MALYFYFNETTGDLVYSDKATYDVADYTSLGQQTNMTPTSSSYWVFNSQRSSIATVSKDESFVGKITKLKRMSSMFASCVNLTSLDLSGFNTSAVTDMGNMFYGCSSLINLDLSDFDTSAVTNMGTMFSNCNSLTNLDLSSFNTSAVIRMDNMFSGCSSLTDLDLSSFDTSAVKNMTSMFESCSSLASLDLSGFDTSVGPRMDSIFKNCDNLTSLNLSSFDTSALTDMVNDTYDMFDGCISLRIIDISPNMSNVLNRLPADTYYDAVTRKSYTKVDIPGGSTYVRDLTDLDLVATMVQTRMGINEIKKTINGIGINEIKKTLNELQELRNDPFEFILDGYSRDGDHLTFYAPGAGNVPATETECSVSIPRLRISATKISNEYFQGVPSTHFYNETGEQSIIEVTAPTNIRFEYDRPYFISLEISGFSNLDIPNEILSADEGAEMHCHYQIMNSNGYFDGWADVIWNNIMAQLIINAYIPELHPKDDSAHNSFRITLAY